MNYNNFITRKEIDEDKYLLKFAMADYVMSMKNPDPILYAELINDATTFAYMFMRNNKNEPLILYPYQDAIINDKHRFKYFRAANQIGKSFLFNVQSVYNLLMDHSHAHNEAIVSKSLPQSVHQMRRIKDILNNLNFGDVKVEWKTQSGTSDSMSAVTYKILDKDGKVKYTNLLVCAPCTEGLLGYDLHALNLDEFEFWDVDLQYFFNQIGQPRTYTTKGKIMVMSNPNGADNFGSKLERQVTPEGDKKWHTYVFNFLDCPTNTQAEYDQLKVELSRTEFESTVDAVRSLSDRNYFSADEIAKSEDTKLSQIDMVGKQPFFFLDVGAKHDQSVLCGGYVEPDTENDNLAHIYMPIIHEYPVGYPLTRVAGDDNVDDSDGWHHEKSVKEYLTEWSTNSIVPSFGFDVTGNSGMKALFETLDINAIDIVFSGPDKSGMYQRFKYFMEKGLLHRIPHENWKSQASQLVVTKGVRGYLLINAASVTSVGGKSMDAKLKKIPDDCMDATAGFIQLCDPKNCVVPHLKFF